MKLCLDFSGMFQCDFLEIILEDSYELLVLTPKDKREMIPLVASIDRRVLDGTDSAKMQVWLPVDAGDNIMFF